MGFSNLFLVSGSIALQIKKVKVSHSLIAVRAFGSSVSWAQLMKDGAHPSPLAALSFPNSEKIPIHCWVDREIFAIVAWELTPYGLFAP